MKPSERKLYDYVEEYAQKRGEERFLADEENSYTVSETFGIVKSLAEQLENAGVKSGDFVSVKADRTVKTILVFYALEIMGAVAVMHDPRERMTQWRRCTGRFSKSLPIRGTDCFSRRYFCCWEPPVCGGA